MIISGFLIQFQFSWIVSYKLKLINLNMDTTNQIINIKNQNNSSNKIKKIINRIIISETLTQFEYGCN